MDVIVFGGQSNMQGQTEAPPAQIEPAAAFEYLYGTDRLAELRHPVGENLGDIFLGAHEGNGSLVPYFCEAYAARTGQKVVAVHTAKGATTIREWLPHGPRYRLLVQKTRGALRAARAEKLFFVWLQGESDAVEGTKKQIYQERMQLFRDALFEDLPLDAFCIIRVGKFTQDARDLEILRAQEELCRESGFILLTRVTGECTKDPARYINPKAAGHYNNAAMRLIGQRAGENLAHFRMGETFLTEIEPYGEELL